MEGSMKNRIRTLLATSAVAVTALATLAAINTMNSASAAESGQGDPIPTPTAKVSIWNHSGYEINYAAWWGSCGLGVCTTTTPDIPVGQSGSIEIPLGQPNLRTCLKSGSWV